MLHKLSIKAGCPHHVFWDDDPSFFWDYVDVYVESQEQEVREKSTSMDIQAWLTGSYFVKALSTFGMMVKKPEPYPSEPFSISRQEKEKEKTSPTVSEEDVVKKQQLELMAALLSYNQKT